jgi:hypothetical protein
MHPEQLPALSLNSGLKRIFGSRKNILLSVAIFGFVVLRFFVFADYREIWIDEQASINAACGDSSLHFYSPSELGHILNKNKSEGRLIKKIFEANLQNDRSNALVFDYALSAWMQVFGTDPFACRSISLFFFLLCIPFLLLIAFKHLNSLFFLLFLVLSNSLFFRYNFECRTYMMSTFIGLCSSWLLFSYLEQRKTLQLVLYFVLLITGIFSHYLMIVVFIWHFFLLLKNSSASQILMLLFAYSVLLGIVLGTLYWLNSETGFVQRLMQASSTIAKNAPQSVHFKPAGLFNIVTGLFQVILELLNSSLQSILKIRFFVVLIVLPLTLSYLGKQSLLSRTSPFTSLIFIHLIYLTVIAVSSGSTTVFQLCYSIFVLPYYLIALAQSAESESGSPTKINTVLKILIVIIGLADTAGYLYKG